MVTVNYCNCSLFRFRRTWAVVAILTLFVLSRFVSAKKLRFCESTFKIAIFADLHYGENAWTDWGPLQDKRSNHVMSSVIDAENPDFVIFLGDLITANNIPVKNASKYWQQAIAVTKSRNISWASLLGNHDDMAFEWPEEWFGNSGVPMIDCPSSPFLSDSDIECYFQRTTRAELMWLDMKEPLSYSSMGNTSLWPSVSNYVLEVASKKDPNVPAILLYFLDSGGGSYPEVISSIQAKWFNETSAQKNPDSRIPEVIFWHIPSQAYKKVAPRTHLTVRKPCVGSINLERVASQVAEWGIMDILVHKKSVKAVIVGHNHGLDWCCPFKSTWLCFARHTGYGGYGCWPRGARILEFHENPFSVNSWIRMEDGSTHSNIDLTNEFKP